MRYSGSCSDPPVHTCSEWCFTRSHLPNRAFGNVAGSGIMNRARARRIHRPVAWVSGLHHRDNSTAIIGRTECPPALSASAAVAERHHERTPCGLAGIRPNDRDLRLLCGGPSIWRDFARATRSPAMIRPIQGQLTAPTRRDDRDRKHGHGTYGRPRAPGSVCALTCSATTVSTSHSRR